MKKYALITGASSGIGREMAIVLSNLGYDLLLVARRKEKLVELSEEIKTSCIIYPVDIKDKDTCIKLYNKVKDLNIEVVINNAGFGKCGKFEEIALDDELEMIDLNIKAMHTIAKLFIPTLIHNNGYLLNVASIAGMMPSGPYMATYYATKAYVTSFTSALANEYKNETIQISMLCPGPVDTEFNSVADVKFALKGVNAKDVAVYALMEMFKGKEVIIPTATIKAGYLGAKLMPRKFVSNVCAHQQKKKIYK